ncbi:MAG: protein kinase [Chitinophagales bacterium]
MDFLKRYEYNPQSDLIGRGGSSTVYKGYDNNLKRDVAIKRSSSSDERYKHVLNEITQYCQLKHPNIIQYYDYFEEVILDSYGGEQSIQFGIMEYANSGEFTQIINKSIDVNNNEFKDLLIGIINGLAYLHGGNEWEIVIIHRDLKPGNILLGRIDNKLIPKICDFGISKTISDEASNTIDTVKLSTPEYRAPEQIDVNKFGVNNQIISNVDFWALGCIVYEYFKGYSPFGKRNQGLLYEDMEKNILETHPDFTGIPEPFNTLVRRCLIKNANQRVKTENELLAILNASKNDKPGYNSLSLKIQKIINNFSAYKFYLLSFVFLLSITILGIYFVVIHKKNSPNVQNEKNSLIQNTNTNIRIRYTNSNNESIVYVGEVIDGKPNGKGIATYSNGNRYEGEFFDGLRNGKGVYYMNDGTKLNGNFKNNKVLDGVLIDKNGVVVKKGTFKEGELPF